MADVNVGMDRFGATLEELLGSIDPKVKQGMLRAVRKAAQAGRKSVKRNIPEAGIRSSKNGRYIKGWTYRVRSTQEGPQAVIGNRDVPGLAHLLEKGHARVGGGRVQAFPHIADAADETFRKFIEEAEGEVGRL